MIPSGNVKENLPFIESYIKDYIGLESPVTLFDMAQLTAMCVPDVPIKDVKRVLWNINALICYFLEQRSNPLITFGNVRIDPISVTLPDGFKGKFFKTDYSKQKYKTQQKNSERYYKKINKKPRTYASTQKGSIYTEEEKDACWQWTLQWLQEHNLEYNHVFGRYLMLMYKNLKCADDPSLQEIPDVIK